MTIRLNERCPNCHAEYVKAELIAVADPIGQPMLDAEIYCGCGWHCVGGVSLTKQLSGIIKNDHKAN